MGKRSFLDVVRQRNADPGQSTRAVTAAKAAALALTTAAIATGAYVAWNSVTPAPAPTAGVAAGAPAPKAASPVTLLETLRDVTTTDESKRQAATGHVGLTGALLVSPAFVSVLLPDSIVPVLCEVPKCAWYVDAHVAVELVPLLVSAVESGTKGSGLALRRIARWLDTAHSPFEELGDRVYAAKYAALERLLAISGTEAGVAFGGFCTVTPFRIEVVIEHLKTTGRTPSAEAFASSVLVEFPELVDDSLLDAAIDLAAAGLYQPVSSLVRQHNGMTQGVSARIESGVRHTDYAGRTAALQGILRLYHLIAPVRSLGNGPFRDAVERLENIMLITVDDMYCALISVSRVRTADGSYDTSRARRVFVAAEWALTCNQAFDIWYGFPQFRKAATTSYLARFVTENIRNLPSLIEKWDGKPIDNFLGDSIASLSNGNGPRASDFASGLCACKTWSREICTLVAHMAINPERVTSDLVRVVAHMAGQEGVTDSQLENVAGPPGGKTKLSDFLCETWDVTADVVTVAIMIGLYADSEVAFRIAESVAIKGFAKHASTILKGYTGLPKRFQARADRHKVAGYTITAATPLCLLGPALRARGTHGPAIRKTLTEAETQLLVRRWYRSESGLHDPTAPLVLARQSLSDPTRVLIADVVARARARNVPWASELDALIASPGPGKIGFGMLYTE